MKKSVFILSIVLSSFASAAAEVKEFDSANISEVVVQNISGKVDVVSTDSVKTVVTATKNKFSENCTITIENNNKQLVVKIEKTGFFNSGDCDVDLELKIPKHANLDISNVSGSSNVKGDLGNLSLKLISGNLDAEGEFKKINGESVSGDVNMRGLTGGGKLQSVSGAINLTFAGSKINGDIDINTVSGSAILLLPKGSAIKTSLKSISGELSNEIGDSPEADFKISMRSVSGNLKVKPY